MRSAAACAPSAVLQVVRDGGRPLPVASQGAGLGVSRQVVLNKAGSAVPLVPPRKAHVLVRGLCGSAEACLQRRVLQGPRVGVLAGWPCGPAGAGAAARSALGSPVRPERLHLLLRNFARRPFHAPALGPRVAQLGYLAVHGLRQPAHVEAPLPLLRPVVEGPRLLQFAVALQQQRLQVIAGVRPAEPPEHPRLVAGLYGHHAFTLVRLRLWSAGHKRTASQHAQGALLLSCELRRLNRWWCLSRCRCLNRCWCLRRRRLKRRRLWLALWSSRLSRHVLLRFVLAPRGPAPPFRLRCRRSVRLLRLASASCAGASCSVGSI